LRGLRRQGTWLHQPAPRLEPQITGNAASLTNATSDWSLACLHLSTKVAQYNRIGKRGLQSEPMALAVLPLSGELLTVANCPEMTRSRHIPDRESLTAANGLNWLLCLSRGVLRNICRSHSKCPERVNGSTMDPTTGRNRLKRHPQENCLDNAGSASRRESAASSVLHCAAAFWTAYP
jgi:hypothetical protein